jgi:hypothetical protein
MRTSKVFFFVLLIGYSAFTNAQVTEAEKNLKTLVTDTVVGWRTGGVTTINLAQTALINWAAGGENSYAVNGLFSIFANYKSDKNVWDNSLDVGYGLLNQGDVGVRKTDDKIDFLSKYGRKAFTDFYYTALVNFKTQFTPGYNYGVTNVKISNLLAPAYLLAAVGLNYQPNKYFNAFIAPVTGKMTIVNDDDLSAAGAYGVDPGKKTRQEFGGYARMIYSRNDFAGEFMKNVSLTSKIDLFSNYLKDPQNIDVSWENLIALKVNKYISVSINTHLLFDADVKVDTNGDGTSDQAKVQFKEILGVGFSYKF